MALNGSNSTLDVVSTGNAVFWGQDRGRKKLFRACGCLGVALWLALSSPALAAALDDMVLHAEPQEISGPAIRQWGERIREQGWRRYECAPVAEFPGAVLCLFAHSMMMNDIFRGAANAIEAPRGMAGRSALLGIDFRVDDLTAYRDRRYPDGNPGGDAESAAGREHAFLFEALPQLTGQLGARSVIAAAWGNMPTIAHELHHARYFSDAAYRAAVAAYWNEHLSDTERAQIRSVLGSLYDSRNDDLIINEFQAYALPGTASPWVRDLNQKYRAPLREFLRTRGFEPLPAVEDEAG